MEKLRLKKALGFWASVPMVALLGCGVMLVMPGCQSQPYDQADSQVSNAKGVKVALLDGQKQVEATTKALNDLTDPSKTKDSKAQFAVYSGQIGKLDTAAKDIATSSAALRTASNNFFTARSSTINSIANPEVRNTADARLKDAKAKFQTLAAQIDSIQADYQPLVTQFNDLKTLLASDLSKSGLTAASEVTKRAYDQANALRLKTTDVVGQIDTFMAEVAPEAAPAKK
jgi:uncharacterized phage infection (PIP) family protein YhgE